MKVSPIPLLLVLIATGCNVGDFPDPPDFGHRDQQDMAFDAPKISADASADASDDAGSCPEKPEFRPLSLSESGDAIELSSPATSLRAAFSRSSNEQSLRLFWLENGEARTAVVPLESGAQPGFGITGSSLGISIPPEPGHYQEIALARQAMSASEFRSYLLVTGNTCMQPESSGSYRLWFGTSSTAFNTRFLVDCSDENVRIEGLAFAGGHNPYDHTTRSIRIFVYTEAMRNGFLDREIHYADESTTQIRKGITEWQTWPLMARSFATTGRHVIFEDTQNGLVAWDVHQPEDRPDGELEKPLRFRAQAPDQMDLAHLRDDTYLLAAVEELETTVTVERIRLEGQLFEDPIIVGEIESLPESPEIAMSATFGGLALATRFSDGFQLHYAELPTPISSIGSWNVFEPSAAPTREVALATLDDGCRSYVAAATIEGEDADIIDVELFVVR